MKRFVALVVTFLAFVALFSMTAFAGTKLTDFEKIVYQDTVFHQADGNFAQFAPSPFREEGSSADGLFEETVTIPVPFVKMYNKVGGTITFVDDPIHDENPSIKVADGICEYDHFNIKVRVKGLSEYYSDIENVRLASTDLVHEIGHFVFVKTSKWWTPINWTRLNELRQHCERAGLCDKMRAQGYRESEIDSECFCRAFETVYGKGETAQNLPQSTIEMFDMCAVLADFIADGFLD